MTYLKKLAVLLALCIVLVSIASFAGVPSQSDGRDTKAAGSRIDWSVVASGGERSTSAAGIIQGTVGQTAVGTVVATGTSINQGFWQAFEPAGCCRQRGDVDGSGDINVSDITYEVAHLFIMGPAPPCDEEGDVDASGDINIADLTYLVDFIFRGGPPPPPC